MSAVPSESCPRCGAAASGNFCAACGAALTARSCTGCAAPLAPGARFCPRCGTAATGGAAPAPGGATGDRRPWLVAALLAVVAVGAVAWAASRVKSDAPPAMANAGNAEVPDAAGRAPNIENMTPKERFLRLSDRIQQAIETRDTARVAQFFPMAVGAFGLLPPGDRDVDARHHLGLLYAQVGEFALARAQADSILLEAPDNLFADYLRAMAATFAGDSALAGAANRAFRQHYDAQMQLDRPEYVEHKAVLEQYRRSLGAP